MDEFRQSFESLKKDEPGIDLEVLRRRVQQAGQRHRRKGLSMMWNKEFWNGARLAMAACLLLIVAACTVPVSYEQDSGVEAVLQVEGDLDAVMDYIHAQDWDVVNLNVNSGEQGHELHLKLDGASAEELDQLASLAQVADLSIEPWSHEVDGTLFSLMMDRVFNIELDISGMSDEEINAALSEQLAASGFPGEVTIQRSDGFPHVTVDVEMEDGHEPAELRIELQDTQGGLETDDVWVQDGNAPEIELEAMDGMSEEEMRAAILQQLEAQGVNLDSVQVFVQSSESEGEGQMSREVRMEILQEGPGGAEQQDIDVEPRRKLKMKIEHAD